ncbi:hypothetical protein BDW72DRAFT_184755 [Aspergillus terricola var. indicus]
MPYTSSYSQSPSAPHLSEIISLYPEDEPFCAGYAPSQGRRCRMRTNASNRASAMAILNRATKKLHKGQMPSLDLLIDLAHCTLCTRFHQGQAEGLAEKWRRVIERFLDYEYLRPEFQELASLQIRASKLLAEFQRGLEQEQGRRAPTPRSIPATPTTSARAQPRTSSASAPSRFETIATTASTRNSPPVGAYSPTMAPLPASAITSSPAPRGSAQRRVETRPRISRTETTARNVEGRALQSASEVEYTTDRPSSSTGRSFRVSGNMDTQEEVGTTRATAHRTARTTTTSTVSPRIVANNSRSTSDDSLAPALLSHPRPLSLRTAPSQTITSAPRRTATRRTIEGDCSICLEPLQKARRGLDFLSCSDSEKKGYGASAVTDDGEAPGPVSSTTAKDSYSRKDKKYPELTWCKTHCGVNYHAKCMRLWLATAPASTCPTCRGVWINDHVQT